MNSHLKTTLFLDVALCSLVICTDFSKWLPDNMSSHPTRHLYSHQCTLATFTPWKHLLGEQRYYNFLASFWTYILCRYCKNRLHYSVECVCVMSCAWVGEGEKVPDIFHSYWWTRVQLTVLAHYSALCKVQDNVDFEM